MIAEQNAIIRSYDPQKGYGVVALSKGIASLHAETLRQAGLTDAVAKEGTILRVHIIQTQGGQNVSKILSVVSETAETVEKREITIRPPSPAASPFRPEAPKTNFFGFMEPILRRDNENKIKPAPKKVRQPPQITKGKKSLLLVIRLLNLLVGIVGALGVAYDVQYPDQYKVIMAAGSIAIFAILILEVLFKLLFFRGIHMQFLRWFNTGAIGGALIFFPLVISSECASNGDKCTHAQHQVTRNTQGR